MKVFGLTGSIAMGKTTAAVMLKRLGLPIHDADACVHQLYACGGRAVRPIAECFPDAVVDNRVDRGRLSQILLRDHGALARLEGIVHPLVRDDRDRFLARHRRNRTPMVVLDVPLLFESGGDVSCDAVIVVSAPGFLQRRRALFRPGMTLEKLASLLSRQIPDPEKRRRGTVIVPTGLGYSWTFRKLRCYIAQERRGKS